MIEGMGLGMTRRHLTHAHPAFARQDDATGCAKGVLLLPLGPHIFSSSLSIF